ncbi:unnamed protein product [Arctogadus glacialis]
MSSVDPQWSLKCVQGGGGPHGLRPTPTIPTDPLISPGGAHTAEKTPQEKKFSAPCLESGARGWRVGETVHT